MPAAWFPFQVDRQLSVDLPLPPRQSAAPDMGTFTMQAYSSFSKASHFMVMQMELAPGVEPDNSVGRTDVFYTSLTQAVLTSMKAERLSQKSFRVGTAEGLAVDFRLKNPLPDWPPGGTMWVLRAGRAAYLLEYWGAEGSAVAASEKARFLASFRLNEKPGTAPTAAEIARFRVGRFRYLDARHGQTLVERTDTTQTETDPAKGLRLGFGLHWQADGYDITMRSSSASNGAALVGTTMHIRLTGVEGNTYTYWATIEGMIFTGRMQKLD
ncbi:hypothetical protein GCM10027345_44760 [Hymenobacter daeguensis]